MAKTPKPADNADLEHTMGGATTRDAMDAGAPMLPGSPSEPIGPEDALGPGPKRGDYSDRITSGPSMETRIIPEADRTADGAIYELVPQGPRASELGDDEGKGGVSTAAAVETTPALAPTGPETVLPAPDADDSESNG